MKKTYGAYKGSWGIIINNISQLTTRFSTKLMACKLLRKHCKEEALAGLIATTIQCVKGTLLSWIPYLQNIVSLFMVDHTRSIGRIETPLI
jgi:hypothetical protein